MQFVAIHLRGNVWSINHRGCVNFDQVVGGQSRDDRRPCIQLRGQTPLYVIYSGAKFSSKKLAIAVNACKRFFSIRAR